MPAAWIAGAGALLGAGSSIFGGMSAADAQAEAAKKQLKFQKEMYGQTREDLAPYRDSGSAANTEYSNLIGINGPEAQAAARARFQTDPGYAFAMSEGLKAVNDGSSTGFSYNSGGRLKALQERGQGIADQQYGSYLERYNQAAQRGLGAASGQVAANQNYSNAASQALGDEGAAQAGGYLAAASGVNSAISNGLKLYGYSKGWGK